MDRTFPPLCFVFEFNFGLVFGWVLFSCLNCIGLLQELGYMYSSLSRGFPETETELNLDLSRRHPRLSRGLLCKMAQTRDPGKHHQRNTYEEEVQKYRISVDFAMVTAGGHAHRIMRLCDSFSPRLGGRPSY